MPRAATDIPDATLRLLITPGLGPTVVRCLRQRFVTDDRIVGASEAELRSTRGVGSRRARDIRVGLDEADPDRERSAMEAHGATLILSEDDDYPALLRSIPDPPLALWVRGALQPEDEVGVAIVGSQR